MSYKCHRPGRSLANLVCRELGCEAVERSRREPYVAARARCAATAASDGPETEWRGEPSVPDAPSRPVDAKPRGKEPALEINPVAGQIALAQPRDAEAAAPLDTGRIPDAEPVAAKVVARQADLELDPPPRASWPRRRYRRSHCKPSSRSARSPVSADAWRNATDRNAKTRTSQPDASARAPEPRGVTTPDPRCRSRPACDP